MKTTIVMALLAALVCSGCDDEPGETDPDVTADVDPAADVAPADTDPTGDMGPAADMAPTADSGPTGDMAPEPEPAWASTPCADEARVGGFEIALRDGFTSVQGQVADGVVPLDVPVVDLAEGECRLLRPPSLFCEPGCGVGETCGPDGCIAQPGNVDVGPVTVDGLAAAVEMEGRAPVYFYTFRGDLPHPGFAEGDAIALMGAGIAGGDDGVDIPAFALRGEGIAPLEVEGQTLPLDEGQDAQLRWTAPMTEGPGQMHIELNIANHGGTPARIECITDDDGEFAIPAALVDRLLSLGASGFPSVALTRRTVDRTDLPLGCIELKVESTTVLDVEIEGLVSCSFDEDCPEGQTCRLDLTCG